MEDEMSPKAYAVMLALLLGSQGWAPPADAQT